MGPLSPGRRDCGWVENCSELSEISPCREAIRKHAGDELSQKYEAYRDIERFRELALHSGLALASIDAPRARRQSSEL